MASVDPKYMKKTVTGTTRGELQGSSPQGGRKINPPVAPTIAGASYGTGSQKSTTNNPLPPTASTPTPTQELKPSPVNQPSPRNTKRIF